VGSASPIWIGSGVLVAGSNLAEARRTRIVVPPWRARGCIDSGTPRGSFARSHRSRCLLRQDQDAIYSLLQGRISYPPLW